MIDLNTMGDQSMTRTSNGGPHELLLVRGTKPVPIRGPLVRACSLLAAAFVAACGDASEPPATPSGIDLSCGPNMFIAAGSCRPLPPIGSDASAAIDSDADITEGAPASADPLAPCLLAAQDVFFVDPEVDAGPFVNRPQIHTNAGATFFAQAAPGTTEVSISTGQGPAGSLRIWIPNAGSPRPGIYPQGPAATGPSLDLVIGSEGVAIRSGSLTVYDFQAGANSVSRARRLVCHGCATPSS
jgi:hypothetical protein